MIIFEVFSTKKQIRCILISNYKLSNYTWLARACHENIILHILLTVCINHE